MDPGVVIDLFSGIGGASLGFHRAGFDVRGAVDVDEEACAIYRKNLTKKYGIAPEPFRADVREVNFSDIRDRFGLAGDDIDVICGCPPCQNFSSLRDTTVWPEDEAKDELLQTFVRLIREERPSFVFFENVPGIMISDGGQYINWFKDRMQEMGYGIALDIVNAADYGIPQRRSRTIGLCAMGADDGDLSIPEPTHAQNPANGEQPWVTVRDTIDAEKLRGMKRGQKHEEDEAHRVRHHRESTMEIIRAIPENGGSRTDLPDELRLKCHEKIGKAAGNVYGRMSWDEPAPTLTTRCTTPSCGRFLHPEENRTITPREAAFLMTFPEDFELPSKNCAAERVVGNAVPPKLVQNLFSSLLEEGQTT